MEKNLRRKYSLQNENHPGCMWGLLHLLHYHQWHNVKKMLPYKKTSGGRHTGMENSKMKFGIPDTGKTHELFDDEVDGSLIEETMSETSPDSIKARKPSIKKRSSHKRSKEGSHKRRFSSIPFGFCRTDSIHHLERFHSELPDEVMDLLDEVRDDGGTPTSEVQHDDTNAPRCTRDSQSDCTCEQCEVCDTLNVVKEMENNQLDDLGLQLLEKNAHRQNTLDKAKKHYISQKSLDATELHKDVAFNQSKEFLDALEMLNVNKKLVLKVFQDPDYALAQYFQGLHASKLARGLTKSGSFPVVELSFKENIRQKKLQYKQNKSSEDVYLKNLPLMVEKLETFVKLDHGSLEDAKIDKIVDSSVNRSHELRKPEENQGGINCLKEIRKRIKHAIKESKKEKNRISMDAIFHKIPYGHRLSKDAKRESIDQWKESALERDCKESPRSSFESDFSLSTPSKGSFQHMKRTGSLNESLERYSQLFEFTFSRDAKQDLSGRSKLANEDGDMPFARRSKPLGRIHSLPDLESYTSLQNEVSSNAPCSSTPTRGLVDIDTHFTILGSGEQNLDGLAVSTENKMELDTTVEIGGQESLAAVSASSPFENDTTRIIFNGNNDEDVNIDYSSDNVDGLANGKSGSISPIEQETESSNTMPTQPSLISVLESDFQEDIITPAKFSFTEVETDSELRPRCVDFNALDSLNGTESTVNFENQQVLSNESDSELQMHVHVDKKDVADFNYVRDVLKVSGFSENEYFGTWQLPEHMMDPSLFEETEARSPHKSDGNGESEGGSSYDHQLLFDIINEVLLEIYDNSFTYWHWPLSCNCHIRPMPMGTHVLEEVWARISWYLSSQSQLDIPLDYLVARDLSKGDGWMNLQFDSECVGLELEEMILDDLLEEIVDS
ncbi:hypothetical protein GIB67_011794 [Kingdonia uniflora]|uniref:Protein TRM32 n=1 Tax=Kingdonia uniflora TaxID=39325 RepID=A0A7J7NXG8_9MAGN|nr:hypothetical protein GIB67_011794 [Kingdonia uniflora]